MKSFLAGDRGHLPTRCVWSNLSIFNGLEEWFCRNWFVLRNLEAKILKTENLGGLVWEVERNTTPRVHAENTPLRTG
jgi:hypothetical protein